MKRLTFKCFLAMAVVAVILTACHQENEAHYTPDIRFAGPLVLHRPVEDGFHTDTLLVLAKDGRKVMDTIMVGDSVFFSLQFNTFLNNMESILIKNDTAITRIQYDDPEVLAELFLPSSSIEKGEFYTEPGYSLARLQFCYIAAKPSNDVQLKITLSSDSKFSPRHLNIVTPILPAPEQNPGEEGGESDIQPE